MTNVNWCERSMVEAAVAVEDVNKEKIVSDFDTRKSDSFRFFYKASNEKTVLIIRFWWREHFENLRITLKVERNLQI